MICRLPNPAERCVIQIGEVNGDFWKEVATTLGFMCVLCSVAQLCPTLYDPMDCSPPRLLCPWNFSDKNTGLGFHALLPGIFLTPGSNPCLLHWQLGSLPLVPYGMASNWINKDSGVATEHSKPKEQCGVGTERSYVVETQVESEL